MRVGGNDHLAQLIEHRELGFGQKAADSRLSGRVANAERCGNGCRGSELDDFPTAQIVLLVAHHRFPFPNSLAR